MTQIEDTFNFVTSDLNSATMTGVVDGEELVKSFIEKHGEEIQRTTKDFTNKAIGSGYSVEDAFIEFTDNAYDSIEHTRAVNFEINVDSVNHVISFKDDGDGIKDPDKLFQLGGTDKDGKSGKIGKYGIGVSGAVAAIATKCVYNPKMPVYVMYESCRKGVKFTKYILIAPNGETTLGENQFEKCDASLHYTEVKFSNVKLEDSNSILSALEETFEEPLRNPHGINISFCGRQLGKTGRRTFIGDEQVESVNVNGTTVNVKYRIIGGSGQDDRAFEESGLRVYSKKTGRLLAKDVKLWKWFCGKEAQQAICGLRAAIYIEDSLESYKMFNIKSTKNGITWNDFYKKEEFKELQGKLYSIYKMASGNKPANPIGEIKIGSRNYVMTSGKIGADGSLLYQDLGETVVMKKKYTPQEIAALINENIVLAKKLSKKIKNK